MVSVRKTANRPEPRDSADVVRWILRLELEGQSLKSRDVRIHHPVLFKVAHRHFRCWGEALRTAGIDAEAVANRRKWTIGRILRTIHELHRRGVALNYASAIQADYGVVQMAAKLLGSWDQALRTAGYDPAQIRHARRPWTRNEVLDLIRRRAAAGLPIASYSVEPHSVEVASRRIFGSWRAALREAGFASALRRWPVWTKVSVVEGILLRQQAGAPLYCAAAAHEASHLYDAARRLFGKWEHALEIAGIDPATVRRRCPPWTRQSALAELRRRAMAGGLTLRPTMDPVSLKRACRKYFGSWAAALREAEWNPPTRERTEAVGRGPRQRRLLTDCPADRLRLLTLACSHVLPRLRRTRACPGQPRKNRSCTSPIHFAFGPGHILTALANRTVPRA